MQCHPRRRQVLVILAAHPVKMKKDPVSGKFPVPTMYDISGSAAFFNKADFGIAIERDLVKKSGSWFSYKDQRIAQGRENARIYIKEHPEVMEELEEEIRNMFQQGNLEVPDGPEPDDIDDDDDDDLDLTDEE